MRLALLMTAALVAACVPQHNVRPLPDFVNAAIEPGDSVIVRTVEGRTVEFVVTEVTDEALNGDGVDIPIRGIAELKKVAWSRPPSACGGAERLGCSVPTLVSLASNDHAHYRDAFYDACEQHDYCYRHGVRTYGLDREFCDREFLQNMQRTCPRPKDSTFGTIVEILGDNQESSFTCLEIANDFYAAARDFGAKHFQTATSTYCEYNGPP